MEERRASRRRQRKSSSHENSHKASRKFRVTRAQIIASIVSIIAMLGIGAHGIAQRFAYLDPVTALKIWPGHAQAQGDLAGDILTQYLAAKTVPDSTIRTTRALADAGFRGNVFSVKALVALALLNGHDQKMDMSANFFRAVQARTKRNEVTQFWAFTEAARNHNSVEMVRTIDSLLRRFHTRARELTQALVTESETSAPTLAAVRERLSHNPKWARDFLAMQSLSWADPLRVADFHRALLSDHVDIGEDATSYTTNRLVRAGLYQTAQDYWCVMKTGHPAEDCILGLDGRFERPIGETSLDWQWNQGSDAAVDVLKDHGQPAGVTLTTIGIGDGQPVLSRLIVLTEGRYTLSANAAFGAESYGEGTAWIAVQCIGSANYLAVEPLDVKATNRLAVKLRFEVGADCLAQQVRIFVRPASSSNTLVLNIWDLTIDEGANSLSPNSLPGDHLARATAARPMIGLDSGTHENGAQDNGHGLSDSITDLNSGTLLP